MLAILCCSARVELTSADEPVPADQFAEIVRPFLRSHCHDCHGPVALEAGAGLRIDQMAPSFDQRESFDRWLKVFRKLEAGEMPPKDEPRPPHADVTRVAEWIEQQLIDADRKRQERDGRVVLRRLNRFEYENTIS